MPTTENMAVIISEEIESDSNSALEECETCERIVQKKVILINTKLTTILGSDAKDIVNTTAIKRISKSTSRGVVITT